MSEPSKLRVPEVARAVASLVEQHPDLPIVIVPDDVAAQIVTNEMVRENIDRLSRRLREQAQWSHLESLIKEGLFKAGCEHYGHESGNPFCLVTAWFFDRLMEGDMNRFDAKQIAQILLDMRPEDVKRSLPMRSHKVLDDEGVEHVAGGHHVGAIIFPRDSLAGRGTRYPLLQENEKRRRDNGKKGLLTIAEKGVRAGAVVGDKLRAVVEHELPRIPAPRYGSKNNDD